MTPSPPYAHLTEFSRQRVTGQLTFPNKSKKAQSLSSVGNDGSLSALSGDEVEHESGVENDNDDVQSENYTSENPSASLQSKQNRKRKRNHDNDDIEGAYMQRLAREEEKEDAKRSADSAGKRQMVQRIARGSGASDDEKASEHGLVDDQEGFVVPLHESLGKSKEEDEVEKASRTVFLGNVSVETIKSKTSKKTLLDHMASIFPNMPTYTSLHKVESIRFRSTAFSTTSVPKKAAFVKAELMEATTKSTNAYVVYSTASAAREAVKVLNGTVVLDRHLRVDGVAHPAKVDHRRCVFVGNLGFVDDESFIKAAEQGEGEKKSRKPKQPSDIEEGLWRQFGTAGVVESVRVIRDKNTRIGKGFAYVQFVVRSSLVFHTTACS